MMASPEYVAQLEQMHENPNFGAGGSGMCDAWDVQRLCARYKTRQVLDYGCGKGMLAHAMPFAIWEYDPGIPTKSDSPEPADLVVCVDVLEHVEPEYLDAVLDDLRRLVKRVGLFAIALTPAQKTLPDGRNAHICLMSAQDWARALADRFTIVDVRMSGGMDNPASWMIVTVEPRR